MHCPQVPPPTKPYVYIYICVEPPCCMHVCNLPVWQTQHSRCLFHSVGAVPRSLPRLGSMLKVVATWMLFSSRKQSCQEYISLCKCGHARRHMHLLCVHVYMYIKQNEPPCFVLGPFAVIRLELITSRLLGQGCWNMCAPN